jgi:hypothetical protein
VGAKVNVCVGVWVRVGVGCGVNVVEGSDVGVAVGRVVPCPQAGREIIIKITTMIMKNRFILILPRKTTGSIVGNKSNRQTPTF